MSIESLCDPADWLRVKLQAIQCGLDDGDQDEFRAAINILDDAVNFAFARDNDDREFFKKELLGRCLKLEEL